MSWIQSSYCDSNACIQWNWITSSYSAGNGACVQWAWAKSSHCDSSACIQWAWIKSSYSLDTADCVEVAQDAEIGVLRDSKDPEGPVLTFPRQAVREFLAGVKAGEFNR